MGHLPAHGVGVTLLEMTGKVTAAVLSWGRTEDTGVVLLEEVEGGRTAPKVEGWLSSTTMWEDVG